MGHRITGRRYVALAVAAAGVARGLSRHRLWRLTDRASFRNRLIDELRTARQGRAGDRREPRHRQGHCAGACGRGLRSPADRARPRRRSKPSPRRFAPLGRRAEIHAADLRGEGEPARLASLAKERFGRLDILVNNAGATRRGDFFDAHRRRLGRRALTLKFFAQVRLCRAAWPLLKDSRRLDRRHRRHRRPRAGRRLHDRLVGDRRAACLHEGAGRPRQARRRAGQQRSIRARSTPTASAHRLGIVMQRTGLDEAAAIEHHRKELDITRFGQPEDIAGLVAFIVSPRGRWLHGAGDRHGRRPGRAAADVEIRLID